MKLLRGSSHALLFNAGAAVTIGNFDGVHRGHQALLLKLQEQALKRHLPVVVMLFEPQPCEYFSGIEAKVRLYKLREKIKALREYHVDFVICLKFNETLASMEAQEFARRYIFSALNAKYILIGQDFRFGQKRMGDVQLLQTLAYHEGCEVDIFPDFYCGAERVSSTKIRASLQHDLKEAEFLLGRPFAITGRVVRGDGRGRQWGVPTANVSLTRLTLPLRGVYCVEVTFPDNSSHLGVANIGCRPTVDGLKNILEVHLLNWSESLYGKLIEVKFLHKLRSEQKFSTLEELIAEIHKDKSRATQWFQTREMIYD